tara:strand:+ start:5326 stop:5604 length:279 start_codon:yes stop_codon:yes gene_type:complete
MKVIFLDKEWEVKNPTYKEKRELWKQNSISWKDGELKQEEYFELLNSTEDITGLSPEDYTKKDGEPLSMTEIDLLLQQILLNYLGLSTEQKK